MSHNLKIMGKGHRSDIRTQLWWEWDQDARSLSISRVRFPVVSTFIPLLTSGPFLEGKARDEHQKQRQEEWPQYACIKCREGSAVYIMIGCR